MIGSHGRFADFFGYIQNAHYRITAPSATHDALQCRHPYQYQFFRVIQFLTLLE
jgi:hypothetical protein